MPPLLHGSLVKEMGSESETSWTAASESRYVSDKGIGATGFKLND
jgi:hypothetical protein